MLNRSDWVKIGIVLFAASIASACRGDASNTPSEQTTQKVHPAAGLYTWTTADGNRIPYEIGGNPDADVTVVLVHCWMCNRTYWDAQLPALAADYRTIALDLPGHGEATAERKEWTISGLGEDLAGLIDHLEVENVIFAGHSMGGPISLRAAALLHGKVLGIVAVDTLHDVNFKFEDEQVDAFMRAFETDFAGTCGRFLKQMIPEEGVEELATHIQQTGCAEERSVVGIALMRDFGALDLPTWFRDAGVPIRAINASAPNPTNIEGNRQYADFDVVLMDGVGHFLHMTRPKRFNELFLETIGELVEIGGKKSTS